MPVEIVTAANMAASNAAAEAWNSCRGEAAWGADRIRRSSAAAIGIDDAQKDRTMRELGAEDILAALAMLEEGGDG